MNVWKLYGKSCGMISEQGFEVQEADHSLEQSD